MICRHASFALPVFIYRSMEVITKTPYTHTRDDNLYYITTECNGGNQRECAYMSWEGAWRTQEHWGRVLYRNTTFEKHIASNGIRSCPVSRWSTIKSSIMKVLQCPVEQDCLILLLLMSTCHLSCNCPSRLWCYYWISHDNSILVYGTL